MKQRVRHTLVGPKRKGVQILCALLFVALPVVQLNGDALLRLDVGTRTLHFFGASLRVVEFRLLLVALLLLLFGFLLMTMVLGRVWCGWLCPQTALSDLTESLDRKISRLTHSRAARAALREGCHGLIAFGIAAVLLWYVVPAGAFLRDLGAGELGPVAGPSFLIIGAVTYLNLALLRRHFCKAICPYGRLQFFTMDEKTLTLRFEESEGRPCTGCGACRAVCPMGIDIREGNQVLCINCGRCLDACRRVSAKGGGEGLIHYRFGTGNEEEKGWGRRFLLAGAVTLLSVGLVAGILTRPGATLKVQHAPGAMVKRLPGSVVNFYSAYIENRGTGEQRYDLSLSAPPGLRCQILGPVHDIVLPPNGNRRVDFAVQVSPDPARPTELQLHLLQERTAVAQALLPLLSE